MPRLHLQSGQFHCFSRQRPYHVENTSSRLITEVKQHRARSVLGWETAWEHWVLLSLLHLTASRISMIERKSTNHSDSSISTFMNAATGHWPPRDSDSDPHEDGGEFCLSLISSLLLSSPSRNLTFRLEPPALPWEGAPGQNSSPWKPMRSVQQA